MKPIKLATEPNLQVQSKPRLGQGRAGPRRKMKIPVQIQPQIQTGGVDQVKEQTFNGFEGKQKEVVQPLLTESTTDRSIGHMPETCIIPDHTIRPKINTRHIPFYQDPLIKPPLTPPDIRTQDNRRRTLDLDLDIKKDFEENSPYQEGIILETY